jgi:hypothetical protein
MFSRLPEADQKALLRQASDQEFERYVTHAHQKIRAPMRQERAAKPIEAPVAAPGRGGGAGGGAGAGVAGRGVGADTGPPRGRTRADELLGTSSLGGR